jgi:predicted transcriptional regulator
VTHELLYRAEVGSVAQIELKPDGKKALDQLASVLRSAKHRDFMAGLHRQCPRRAGQQDLLDQLGAVHAASPGRGGLPRRAKRRSANPGRGRVWQVSSGSQQRHPGGLRREPTYRDHLHAQREGDPAAVDHGQAGPKRGSCRRQRVETSGRGRGERHHESAKTSRQPKTA